MSPHMTYTIAFSMRTTMKNRMLAGWQLWTLEFHRFEWHGCTTWWLIPLSKWVITPVISGLTLLIPFITGVITHLLSGMSHQVKYDAHSLGIKMNQEFQWFFLFGCVGFCTQLPVWWKKAGNRIHWVMWLVVPTRSTLANTKLDASVNSTITGWWFFALPLWKMMEFVSWDYDIPKCFWKVIKVMFQSTNQIIISSTP